MNLATIDVDPDEAQAKLREYQSALVADRSAEDAALAQAYRAAARGLPVLKLSEAIHAGGYFDSGLPRLAIIRADLQECWINASYRWPGATFVYGPERWPANRGALVGTNTVRVSTPHEPGRGRLAYGARTMVPIIPPRHRPRRPRLRSCHVLWEVEAWEPVPPRDPALLRHLRGDLWAVLAVWDLTELERAVLSQRAH